MVLSVLQNLQFHRPSSIGWQASVKRALRLRKWGELGATELLVFADPTRPVISSGTVLTFRDYGQPDYAAVTLTADLQPGEDTAQVTMITQCIPNTARAAIADLDLAGSTLAGKIRKDRTSITSLGTFAPAFVGAATSGQVQSQLTGAQLEALIPAATAEAWLNPPFLLETTITLPGGSTIVLLMGQNQNDAMVPSGADLVIVEFSSIVAPDVNYALGNGGIAIGPITIDSKPVLPQNSIVPFLIPMVF